MELQPMRPMTTQNQPRSAAEIMLIAEVIQGVPVNLTQAAARMGRISLRETANRLEEIGISISEDFLPYHLTHQEHGGLLLRYTNGE